MKKRRKKKKWIQGAINPKHKGMLHRALGVKKGKKIPWRLLQRHKHATGAFGRRVRFAINMRRAAAKRKKRSR